MSKESDEGLDPGLEGGDKRSRLRAPLLVLKVRLDDGGKVFFGYARNISRSGIFIASANPRTPGNRFQLEMALPAPTNLTFQVTCEVVWKREFSLKSRSEPGMGLKFLDLPGQVADRIGEWVQTHSEDIPKE
jgi:hypothetical protein